MHVQVYHGKLATLKPAAIDANLHHTGVGVEGKEMRGQVHAEFCSYIQN